MPLRLTREEYLRWAEGQPKRYERIAGEPVAMSPERAQHVPDQEPDLGGARSGHPAGRA